MTNEGPRSAREERLAAKLRENLRRRKIQARELPTERLRPGDHAGPDPAPDPGQVMTADSGLSKGTDGS